MAENRESREVLLHRLQVCDFILVELNEYLDTHPDDPEAIRCFEKHRAMREEAMEDYTKHYGPITIMDHSATYGNQWRWVDGPSPWDLEKEGV